MKNAKYLIALALAVLLIATATTLRAADATTSTPKPYPLDTCLVCGMKLGEMGPPLTFVYKGQEIKVCDKSEKADFEKSPDKFLKTLAEAQAKLKK
jgi:nitrous oxide reductase accessory protein NosL